MRFLFFILVIFVCSQNALYAQDRVSAIDHLTASTFKALAKGYVATVDLERIKKDQIARLNKMNDQKFKKHFQKVSLVLNSLPSELKIKYGFKDPMTKEDVVKEIGELDKKNLNQMIDDIPETFIIFQFRQYLAGLKEDFGQNNIVRKIHEFWDKITPQAER